MKVKLEICAKSIIYYFIIIVHSNKFDNSIYYNDK
jgi:hypothetical protein